MADNSPTFQRWDSDNEKLSPEGTAENRLLSAVPSGLIPTNVKPNVETLGYDRLSLRDGYSNES